MLKTEKNIEEAVQALSRQMGHTNETLGNLFQEFRRTNNMLRVFVETIGSNEQTYKSHVMNTCNRILKTSMGYEFVV